MRSFLGIFSLCLASVTSTNAHVTLLGPSGGETFGFGDVITISWQEDESHEPVDWDIYFSPDGGETWDEIASVQIEDREYAWMIPNVETEQGQIRVVQDNVDVDYEAVSDDFRISSIGVVTALEIIDRHSNEFELLANYPNPFGNSTTLEFWIPQTTSVLMEIYNLHGAKVATLVNAVLPAGRYAKTWEAEIESGVYLCSFRAGGFVSTQKLIKSP